MFLSLRDIRLVALLNGWTTYFQYQCIHWHKFENDEVERFCLVHTALCYILEYIYILDELQNAAYIMYLFSTCKTRPNILHDLVEYLVVLCVLKANTGLVRLWWDDPSSYITSPYFHIKSISLHPLLCMNVILDFICVGVKRLEILMDNIFVVLSEKVFQQTVGIPRGTNCAPLLANIFLCSYEAESIQALLSTEKKH